MKRTELEGVRSNELRSNTTPIATTHNSDLRFIQDTIITTRSKAWGKTFGILIFKCRSHEETTNRKRVKETGETLLDKGLFKWQIKRRKKTHGEVGS